MTTAELPSSPAPQQPAAQILDCWNGIGVYGNNSCPKLAEFSHCRNCPVYSAAGSQLLDRPLPPEYRRQWAAHFAREKRERATGTVSAVIFRLHNEWLALPTQAFHEVAEHRSIHSLPHRRQGRVLGLVNVRGELLIAISLGQLLGLGRLPSPALLRTAYQRILVAHWDGARFAFPVEEVQGPHRFDAEELKPPPATVAKASPAFCHGILQWQNRTVGLLDVELVFSSLNQGLT